MSAAGDRASLEQAVYAGFGHQRAGRLREAEQIYRQVLARDPNNFDALQLLGLLAHHTGHHADAVELIGRALAVNGTFSGVRANYASALRAAGRPDAALAEAQAVLRVDPRSDTAWRVAALVLSEAGRMDLAVDAWQRLVALQPDNPEASATLAAACEALGRLDE